MADPVSEAKKELHDVRHERQERAAAWWQQAVIEGRVIRQSRAEMQQSERQTPQETQTQTSRSRRSTRQP